MHLQSLEYIYTPGTHLHTRDTCACELNSVCVCVCNVFLGLKFLCVCEWNMFGVVCVWTKKCVRAMNCSVMCGV